MNHQRINNVRLVHSVDIDDAKIDVVLIEKSDKFDVSKDKIYVAKFPLMISLIDQDCRNDRAIDLLMRASSQRVIECNLEGDDPDRVIEEAKSVVEKVHRPFSVIDDAIIISTTSTSTKNDIVRGVMRGTISVIRGIVVENDFVSFFIPHYQRDSSTPPHKIHLLTVSSLPNNIAISFSQFESIVPVIECHVRARSKKMIENIFRFVETLG